jgi:phosphatidate cytidylyltransferase
MNQTTDSSASNTHDLPSPKSIAAAIPTNTWTRMVSALILLPLVIFAWVSGGIAFTIVLTGAFMIATLEIVTILRGGEVGVVTWVAVATSLAVIVTLITHQPGLATVAALIGGVVMVALEVAAGRRDPFQIMLLPVVTVILALIGSMSILIRDQLPGVFWWLLIFVGTWGTDTLAFAGGHAYGKTPLAPAWSPKKTIEGTLTGVIGAIGIGIFMLAYFRLLYPSTVVIVLLTPFAAVIGDLLESKFKRIYDVKDSSVKGFNIMPGHGGMLDRIDSMMAVVTLVFLVLAVAGW